jgi:hypothetical protein
MPPHDGALLDRFCLCHGQAIINIRISSDFSPDKAASGLEVVVPMPREVQRVHCELARDAKPTGGQSWDWQERTHKLVWKFKRVQGSSDHNLRVRAHHTIHSLTATQMLDESPDQSPIFSPCALKPCQRFR